MFSTLILKIYYKNVFVNPISLALEVTKQWYSKCICWKFSIWFKFDSENAIIILRYVGCEHFMFALRLSALGWGKVTRIFPNLGMCFF